MSLLILIILFSLDNLFIGSIYAIKKIKVKFNLIILISLINTCALLFSLIFGNFFKMLFPNYIIKIILFLPLFLFGLYNIFQEKIKSYISKYFHNKFVNVFLDETKADFNKSNDLSVYECLILSIVLSLDSLFGGISFTSYNINIYLVLFVFWFINLFFFLVGNIIGKKVNKFINVDFSLVSGIIFIIFSIINLF